MARSLTFPVRLAKFFPKTEPMARLMARLCVLWQDLLFEHAGILDDDGFASMDGKCMDKLQRRLYFVRANSRTLYSAVYLLTDLAADKTFKGWLAADVEARKRFFAAKKNVDRHQEVIAAIRNRFGAHTESDFGDAIDDFTDDDEAFMEIHSDDFMRPHLAMHLTLAALTKGSASDQRTARYRQTVEPLALATNAMIAAMSEAVGIYADKLGLLPE